MTKFIGKSLLTGDKLMPEMHLKHPGFTYSACGTFSKHPSKHLLVFKTSWRRLQDMSWRRLQHVFSVTILRLPRRLENVLKTSWRRFQDLSQDVFKTSSRRLQDVLEDEKLLRWRLFQDVLKTCLEDDLKTGIEDFLKTCLEDVLKSYLENTFKTSWRQTKFLLVISVSSKSKCVSNKSLFHKLYLRNLRWIQNMSLRTQ